MTQDGRELSPSSWPAAGTGKHPVRAGLIDEVIRLAQILHRLMPAEPEPSGLPGCVVTCPARRGEASTS